MKKKLLVALTIITAAVISLSAVSFAAEGMSPSDTLAALTGRSLDSIQADREDGLGYGVQAEQADVLDEFRDARQEVMEERVETAIEEGRITQEEVDQKLEEREARIASCEGDPGACQQSRGEYGLRIGDGAGDGSGLGTGEGRQSKGNMNGTGLGLGRGRMNR